MLPWKEYLVWCETWGQEKVDAKLVEASNPRYAAETFAEDNFDEPFKEIDVIVKDPDDGTEYRSTVKAEWVVHFHAKVRE